MRNLPARFSVKRELSQPENTTGFIDFEIRHLPKIAALRLRYPMAEHEPSILKLQSSFLSHCTIDARDIAPRALMLLRLL